MMNEFNKYPLNKYLVAVSTGPDSMALLHKLLSNNYQVIVCFVNYHHRINSNDEEILIKNFCKKYQCILEIHSCYYQKEYGNFENWAREERYEFFSKIGKKYNINNCFVAHHLDDLLETYLIQKQRGYVEYYGLKESVVIKNINIIRPLLKYTKQELQDYCKHNEIIYSYDYTNEDVSLLRNKIRHKILSNYSYEEKMALFNEIKIENEKIKIINEKINSIIKDTLNISLLKELTNEEQDRLLYLFIKKYLDINLSKKRIEDIKKKISKSGNQKIELNNDYYLIKEYECLNLVKNRMFNYSLVVDKPSIIENEFIKFDLISNPNYFYIKEDSYPLTIKIVEKDKKIKIGKIHKSINRLLIDEKIPYLKRLYWPMIVNNKQEIIFVPRSCKGSLFIVKDIKNVI